MDRVRNRKELSERDICTKLITPALRRAGWNEQTQLREEVTFTKGRVIVRGRMVSRGKRLIAVFVLHSSQTCTDRARKALRPSRTESCSLTPNHRSAS